MRQGRNKALKLMAKGSAGKVYCICLMEVLTSPPKEVDVGCHGMLVWLNHENRFWFKIIFFTGMFLI